MNIKSLALLLALALPIAPLQAQTLKLLTAGAFKEVVLAVLPGFEARTGLKVEVASDTAGGLVRRIEGGQDFDVVIVTRDGIKRLASAGAVASETGRDIATVGIGIGMKEGGAPPPLATVEQFKSALRLAKGIAYIDPASGGSSGIYLDGLFRRLEIAELVRPKAVLVPGGLAAERVLRGEADIALQQASEILPVKGVVLVGMLPEAIQSYTTYAAGVSTRSASKDAARALLDALSNPQAAEIIRAKGMTPASRGADRP